MEQISLNPTDLKLNIATPEYRNAVEKNLCDTLRDLFQKEEQAACEINAYNRSLIAERIAGDSVSLYSKKSSGKEFKAAFIMQDMENVSSLATDYLVSTMPEKEQKAFQRNMKFLEGLQKTFESDTYKEFLTTASRFYNYSMNNQMLIFSQKPDATMVAGANVWKKDFERYINKGEKAITILAPSINTKIPYLVENPVEVLNRMRNEVSFKEDALTIQNNTLYCKTYLQRDLERFLKEHNIPFERKESLEYISFVPKPVFDVSQTNGKEIVSARDLVAALEGDVPHYDQLISSITEIAFKNGITSVSFHEKEEDSVLTLGANGYYRPAMNEIVIKKGMSEAQTISTFVHEVAHALMHGKEMKVEGIENTNTLTRSLKELQAESVSYMVCSHLGIETDTKSFGYITTWIQRDTESGMDIMRENLDIISKCTKKIMKDGLEKTLEQIKSEQDFELEQDEEDLEYA